MFLNQETSTTLTLIKYIFFIYLMDMCSLYTHLIHAVAHDCCFANFLKHQKYLTSKTGLMYIYWTLHF